VQLLADARWGFLFHQSTSIDLSTTRADYFISKVQYAYPAIGIRAARGLLISKVQYAYPATRIRAARGLLISKVQYAYPAIGIRAAR